MADQLNFLVKPQTFYDNNLTVHGVSSLIIPGEQNDFQDSDSATDYDYSTSIAVDSILIGLQDRNFWV
jgi:hypothetical protein